MKNTEDPNKTTPSPAKRPTPPVSPTGDYRAPVRPPPAARAPVKTPHREPLIYDSAALPPLPHELTLDEALATQGRRASSTQAEAHPQNGLSIMLWLALAILFGLAIGITLAMLLASGELDLSLKDVKLIFKSINFSRT